MLNSFHTASIDATAEITRNTEPPKIPCVKLLKKVTAAALHVQNFRELQYVDRRI
jgi:hypothetical protein